jgi:hypothetical protein
LRITLIKNKTTMKKNFIYDLMLPYFVGSDENRPQLSQVHKGKNGYVYATDAYIAIRIPADRVNMEYSEAPNFPDAERLIQGLIDMPGNGRGVIKTDLLIRLLSYVNWHRVKGTKECDECNGAGTRLYWGHDDDDCDKCNGTGEIEGDYIEAFSLLQSCKWEYSIGIRESVYRADYLYIIALMAKLLQVEEIAYLHGGPKDPGIFSFDGLNIALAPTLLTADAKLPIEDENIKSINDHEDKG